MAEVNLRPNQKNKMSTTTIASKVPKKRKASEAIEITNRHAVIGAPAQRTQSSRKGKKAWRKNVDIGDVEQGLEEIREEERVVGYVLATSLYSDTY